MPKRSLPSLLGGLPPCEGPKLGRFEHYKSRIKWLERLGGHEASDTPAEGYVFRAEIDGRQYAIKVFKFHDPMSSEPFWEPLLGEDTTLTEAAYYTDPFYAECRAYGRIGALSNKDHKRIMVVPCHGYLFLQARDEKILKNRNVDLELDKVDLAYQQSTPGGFRARAIVKDLVSSDSGVYDKSLADILSGIVTLNRLGIYNLDIRLDNFRDGKIVDFGSSWTEPHKLLDELDDQAVRDTKLADRVMFDQMIRDEGIPNPKQVLAFHRMKLRSD